MKFRLFPRLLSALLLASNFACASSTPIVVVTEPPPLTALFDTTVAGINARLGPSYSFYHPNPEVIPSLYVRPLTPIVVGTSGRLYFSEGLGTETTDPYDYASTEGQGVCARPSLGIPDRIRPNQSDGGVVTAAPQPAQSTYSPDADFAFWTNLDGITVADLGQCLTVTRARRLQSNGAAALFSSGWVRTTGTVTAKPNFGGFKLPANKKPLCMILTTLNEFLLIGVHDTDTGKGEICVVSCYGGGHLNADWPVAHPGLMNAAIWDGAKILGYVDLGIAYPTSISAVSAPCLSQDRIQAEDGNAGNLADWDISTQAGRDSFLVQNGNWIASWGHCVVTSKPEGKAVFVDLTALYAGVRSKFFTNDAAYAETLTPAWPYTFAHTPAWTPTVTATVNITKPTYCLIDESGAAKVAIATESGTVYFYTRLGVADGSVYVGNNPVHLTYSKYKTTFQTGRFIATCRGDRSIVWVDKTGAGAAIVKTLRDSRLVDPVWTEVSDMHGIDMEEITVADFLGQKWETYRCSVLEFLTQGEPDVPVQDGAQFEGNPSLPCASGGYPFCFNSSNVN